MLLIHKDISHMPIIELENESESVWVKVFASETSNFVASWYQPPGRYLIELTSEIELLSQLQKIESMHKGNKPPSVHVLGDFNFRDIVSPDYEIDLTNQVHVINCFILLIDNRFPIVYRIIDQLTNILINCASPIKDLLIQKLFYLNLWTNSGSSLPRTPSKTMAQASHWNNQVSSQLYISRSTKSSTLIMLAK